MGIRVGLILIVRGTHHNNKHVQSNHILYLLVVFGDFFTGFSSSSESARSTIPMSEWGLSVVVWLSLKTEN